jgi:SAM-dependent methyltransferase
MTTARSIGVVTNGSADRADVLLASLQSAGFISPATEITYLDTAYASPGQDNSVRRRHLFWDEAPPEGFDLVASSASVRFFESLWGRAFITLLIRNCRNGGLILVPRAGNPQENPSQYFSVAKLEPLLGKGNAECVANYACFRRPETTTDGFPSLLLWASEHVSDTDLRRFVSGPEAMEASSAQRLLGTGLPVEIDSGFEAELARTTEFGSRSDAFGDPASVFLRTLTYWIGGLAYKTPAVTAIARLCGVRRGAALVDYGGGIGQLALDCVLDPDSPVEHATAVDLSPGNAAIFAKATENMRPVLKDRVRFVAGSFAHWLPKEPVDIITCLGALLYLPRDAVDATLSRWWDCLKPGGVLLVHENIRQPDTPPSRDSDRMFSDPEITAVLERLGKQRFFALTAMKELSPAAAAGKSVFRFIQKAR